MTSGCLWVGMVHRMRFSISNEWVLGFVLEERRTCFRRGVDLNQETSMGAFGAESGVDLIVLGIRICFLKYCGNESWIEAERGRVWRGILREGGDMEAASVLFMEEG